MAGRDDDILNELKNISFVLGDLNAIRNGEYEPPRGADTDSHRREPLATTDDVYRILGTVVSLLERQNQMIYNIGQNAVENEEFWHKQNRNY